MAGWGYGMCRARFTWLLGECEGVCSLLVCGEHVNPLNVPHTGEWGCLCTCECVWRVASVRACMHVCVLGVWSVLSRCVFQTAPTLALPGSGISKNFLSSLDQEAQGWGWLKAWPRASRGKDTPAGVCVAESGRQVCGFMWDVSSVFK